MEEKAVGRSPERDRLFSDCFQTGAAFCEQTENNNNSYFTNPGKCATLSKDQRKGGRQVEERRENFSRKRAAILAVLQNTKLHPTAEWVYAQLKPEYPDLSLGTVYRNLNRLREKGQAASLGTVGGRERFDGDVSPHAHLVCEKCGAVLDVPARMPEAADFRCIAEETGCRVRSASLAFRGLCPDCAGETGREEPHAK